MAFDTICVVGLGYIGLPTAAVFASRGKRVLGVDVNPVAVAAVNAGKIHIVEPDLDEVVKAAVANGHLTAQATPSPADAFLIAVPTPIDNNQRPGLGYVEAATRAIAPHLKKGDLVVLESTSPIGTTYKVAGWLAQERPDLTFPLGVGEEADIKIAYCPERVLPGQVLNELVSNDRIIGGLTPASSTAAIELYKIFVEAECVVTNAPTAEMCKLTENSYRDVNIAFANELSFLCAEQGIDAWELISLANRHPRVNILQPGPGVGGHCIAVDPWFLVSASPDSAKLIGTARRVNDAKPVWVVNQVRAVLQALRKPQPTVACLGLSFKANIDDLRESPSMEIAEKIAMLPDVSLVVAEPNVAALPQALAGRARHLAVEEAIKQADLVVLLVDHSEFRDLDTSLLQGKQVIDTRGIWRQAIAGRC